MKVVIIGGVAGGASAAARLRRLDESAEILLLQSGPDVSFASCGMPYFIGGEIKDRSSMAVQTPQSLNTRLNINVQVNTRVEEINTESKTIVAKNERTGVTLTSTYDHLVLAVGAEPFKPPIPGINRPGLFALRNLEDMDAIVAWIHKKQQDNPTESMHCVVAGAGFVGIEMVEQLSRRNIKITVVEMMPQIMAPFDIEMAAILHKDLERRGVAVITGDGISEFHACTNGGDPESTVVVLKSGRVLPPAQMTILGLGLKPDTKIAADAGIECARSGHIIVDEQLRTSAPNVWAVGDAIMVNNPIIPDSTWAIPLAGPANRQGRMAADNIMGKECTYKGTYAASVIRVFDIVAACVGMNEKLVVSKNLPFASIHVHPGSHAGYFPGAKSINFKLVFNPENGAIYGAQAVGEDGVEKRIDVISTAIQGKLTVSDLADLELCYAPPVGSAKDPVNMAGMAAQNIVEGLVTQVDWKELEAISKNPDTVVLDVRNPGEIASNGILVENAVNIPLDSLRGRMHELPKEKRIVVSCASGQRAYYACRVLTQSGFQNVDNLSGAFKTFSSMK